MKRRIEKKRCAIQARRVYHNGRRADVVYLYESWRFRRTEWPREVYECVFTSRPRKRGAIQARCIDVIRVREHTTWSYNEKARPTAAWDARCRKYREGKA